MSAWLKHKQHSVANEVDNYLQVEALPRSPFVGLWRNVKTHISFPVFGKSGASEKPMLVQIQPDRLLTL
jgi:hypothetical protein